MRGVNMPQNPAPAWMGGRAALPFRPRLFMGGPRLFFGETQEREMYAQNPTRAERRRQEQAESGNNAQPPQQNSTWRTRLPAVRMPVFGRRSQQPQQQAQDPNGGHGQVEELATPGELEAGRNQRLG